MAKKNKANQVHYIQRGLIYTVHGAELSHPKKLKKTQESFTPNILSSVCQIVPARNIVMCGGRSTNGDP